MSAEWVRRGCNLNSNVWISDRWLYIQQNSYFCLAYVDLLYGHFKWRPLNVFVQKMNSKHGEFISDVIQFFKSVSNVYNQVVSMYLWHLTRYKKNKLREKETEQYFVRSYEYWMYPNVPINFCWNCETKHFFLFFGEYKQIEVDIECGI